MNFIISDLADIPELYPDNPGCDELPQGEEVQLSSPAGPKRNISKQIRVSFYNFKYFVKTFCLCKFLLTKLFLKCVITIYLLL
jgi:hypothetical protein